MRYLLVFVLFFACLKTAHALTPPLDSSAGFFAGEWSGTGAQGSYCYLDLKNDGRGIVLIDGGSGDWLGAQIQWRNRKQALDVEKIIPLPFSSQLRVMPLERFTVSTELNQTLKLTWSSHSDSCYLQKTDITANNLTRARNVSSRFPASKGTK